MKVLVVEDELEYRDLLSEAMREWGHELRGAEDGEEALEILANFTPHVIITDVMMPRMGGVELIQKLRAETRLPPTIVMTSFGSLERALEVVHELGGFWFVEKPIELEALRLLLDRSAKHGQLALENEILRTQLSFQGVVGDMVGHSAAMQEVFALIRQVAPTSAPVLVTGESGTGKELVARAIHSYSARSTGPFVALNCAAMPEALVESELFGHEKGSFTGAIDRRLGAIEHATGGTLFLDELGEMPMPMQAKLLRVLEDYRFRRIGGKNELTADVRIVAATNRDPRKAMADGHLREDLYYRLNVFEMHLPPLRERLEDIPAIVESLIHLLNRKHGTSIAGANEVFLDRLRARAWEGNVRELRNVVERAVILAGSGFLEEKHLPIARASREPVLASLPEVAGPDPLDVVVRVGSSIEEAEQALIEATLRHTSNNKTRAAGILGITPKTLHTKLKLYRLGAEEALEPEVH
jgi:DNA-binding NtrC family response regulator